jgi:FMN phosphatase YigB (HAD superfamily)
MMIKAVLLDLDDTLLINPDSTFIPAYLQEIDNFFVETISYQGASKAIIAAMKAMVTSTEYDRTNLDIASRTIADLIGRAEMN